MRRALGITVVVAAGVSGAAVMVIEVAGAHMLAPGFGTGLYAWGAMITVTLGALAVGYAVGGRAADRWAVRPGRGMAGGGLLLAGLLAAGAAGCVADALAWRPLVLGLAGLGGRAGAILSAAVLFGVPLAALAAAYPVAVRLRTHRVDEIGRRSGGLSAISAVGSLVGAAMAGFVLVPSLAIETVFAGTAAALLLTAGVMMLAARRTAIGAALAVLAIGPTLLPDRPLPEGALCRRGSLFGPIEVWQEGPLRYLMVARTCQGIGMGDPPKSYMSHVGLIAGMLGDSLPRGASTEPGREVLVIGLGAGFMPRKLDPIPSRTVEIDPAVVAVAEEHFAFDRARWPVTVADGRALLVREDRRYAAVVIDAFNGVDLPYHLFTRECFELIRGRLAPDGMLVVNFEGYFDGADARLAPAIEQTLRTVFAEVDLAVHEKQPGYGSVVFVAHAPGVEVRWPRREVEYQPRQTLSAGREAAMLTDSRNPVALWSARLGARQRAEQIRAE